jgi:hypothetical protein
MLKTWPIRSAGGLGLAILLGGALAAPLDAGWGRAKEDGLDPITRPLPPDYKVNKDGSIRLRICYNWTCATREYVTFSAADIANVKSYLTQCVGENFHDRVQRLRVGVWQLQLVAQKYIPDLVNDREINEYDRDVDGRLDCVDSSTNTTTYLRILQDLGQLTGFTVSNPEVRNLMNFHAVHWTAVVTDKSDGKLWSLRDAARRLEEGQEGLGGAVQQDEPVPGVDTGALPPAAAGGRARRAAREADGGGRVEALGRPVAVV